LVDLPLALEDLHLLVELVETLVDALGCLRLRLALDSLLGRGPRPLLGRWRALAERGTADEEPEAAEKHQPFHRSLSMIPPDVRGESGLMPRSPPSARSGPAGPPPRSSGRRRRSEGPAPAARRAAR